MSWFDRLSGRAGAARAAAPAPSAVSRFPRMAANMPLDVIRESGELVTRARLARFSAWELRLIRVPGDFSLPELARGERVRVQGEARDDVEPFVLAATVAESTRMDLRLDNLVPVEDDGRRTSARRGVWRRAELYDIEDPRRAETAIPCEVVNVSMTGACVRTARAYGVGKRLRLRVELYDKAGYVSFVSEVVRVADVGPGTHEYGLLFAELTRDKRRYLEDDIREMRARAERAVLA